MQNSKPNQIKKQVQRFAYTINHNNHSSPLACFEHKRDRCLLARDLLSTWTIYKQTCNWFQLSGIKHHPTAKRWTHRCYTNLQAFLALSWTNVLLYGSLQKLNLSETPLYAGLLCLSEFRSSEKCHFHHTPRKIDSIMNAFQLDIIVVVRRPVWEQLWKA